jgi:hypothetical protein
MANRAKAISELDALTAPAGEDLLVIVDDPSGTPTTKYVTVANLLLGNTANITSSGIASKTVPANASATGTAGQIRYDSSYVYVCVSTNTWKRAALTTW